MNDLPQEDGLPPMDDQGIRNDEIIEVLEKIIRDTWNDIVGANQQLSIPERKEVVTTLYRAWELARDIMDIDNHLREIGDLFDEQNNGEDPEDTSDY